MVLDLCGDVGLKCGENGDGINHRTLCFSSSHANAHSRADQSCRRRSYSRGCLRVEPNQVVPCTVWTISREKYGDSALAAQLRIEPQRPIARISV